MTCALVIVMLLLFSNVGSLSIYTISAPCSATHLGFHNFLHYGSCTCSIRMRWSPSKNRADILLTWKPRLTSQPANSGLETYTLDCNAKSIFRSLLNDDAAINPKREQETFYIVICRVCAVMSLSWQTMGVCSKPRAILDETRSWLD